MDAPIAAARLPVEMGAPPVESVGSEVGIGAVVSIHGESGDDDPGEVLIAAGVVLVEPAGEVLVEAAGVVLVEPAGEVLVEAAGVALVEAAGVAGEVLVEAAGVAGEVLVEAAGVALVEAAGVPLVELAGASACGGDEESMSASAGGAIATSRTAVSTTRFMNRGRA